MDDYLEQMPEADFEIKIKRQKHLIALEEDEDGMYIVEVPSLPGCISQGRTRAEALENIKEAMTAYLESMEAHNEKLIHRHH